MLSSLALALKILLPPPSRWGLETDWHEFPNCTTYLDIVYSW